MKNFFKAFRIIAIVAMIGIGLAGCDNGSDDDGSDDGGSGGGNVPEELRAKWYTTQNAADTEDTTVLMFEFTASQVIIGSSTMDAKFDGKKLTMTIGSHSTGSGWDDYTVAGTMLTITGGSQPFNLSPFYKK